MSPKNPALLATAEIPVVPTIKAHSIIAMKNDSDYSRGRDGLVYYQSAHVVEWRWNLQHLERRDHRWRTNIRIPFGFDEPGEWNRTFVIIHGPETQCRTGKDKLRKGMRMRVHT
jgi:hypothetical protein